MDLFKSKRSRDPISEREKAIQEELERIQREIQACTAPGSKAALPPNPGKAAPVEKPQIKQHSQPAPTPAQAPKRAAAGEPIFEPLDPGRLRSAQAQSSTAAHYNELGVRKYDLAAAWTRFKGYFKSPTASNPKLVNYLAAGSIQGLRALRYEKRIARRRFVIFFIGLLLLLIGIASALLRRT